jgi:hypothetical protein
MFLLVPGVQVSSVVVCLNHALRAGASALPDELVGVSSLGEGVEVGLGVEVGSCVVVGVSVGICVGVGGGHGLYE